MPQDIIRITIWFRPGLKIKYTEQPQYNSVITYWTKTKPKY